VRHLGLDRPRVRRDKPPRRAPRALDARQQKRYLRAAERRPLARDRAIGRLPFYTGLRVGELTALDTGDVALSARTVPPSPTRCCSWPPRWLPRRNAI
jgi:integrase/recombinase XerC